jgi:putative ABC transport system permease protein
MILLRLITWPYVRRHLVRALLTAAGIVLGVGVFVGMHTANQSVLAAFHRTIDRIAGKTELQVTAGEAGFDEQVLEKIQAVPEVRVAVPAIEAVIETGLPGQGALLVLAVDMTGDRSLRDYDLESGEEAVIEDPLVFLAQPDSLMVTREFARRNGLSINSRVPMRTMEGERTFVVRGIMRAGGLASAFGGNLAVMDIYAAQKVFGRGRHFDRVDIALDAGVGLARGRDAVERALGTGFDVAAPSSRGQQFESVARVYSISVSITSLFALVIGMFIIYNSFAIAVTERRPEIGILRALGATRRQIQTLFLGESLVAGVLGSVLGVGFGIVMAHAMAGYVGGLLEGVYGLAQQAEEIEPRPALLVFAVVMGVATSLVAALVPARSAARVDPIKALQKGQYQVLSAGENRVRRGAAIVLVAAAAISLAFGRYQALFYGGYVLALVAALLLTPTLALWLTRALRPMLQWVRPVEGALAADSLIQAPRRTSATVAALMLSIALVIALGGLARASYVSILDWVNTSLNPDLFVTGSESLTNRNFRFPSSFGAELARVAGIDEVQMVRSARMTFRGRPVLIVAVDVGGWSRRARREPIEGDADTMYRVAGEGRGFIVSDNFAGLHDAHLGDSIELATPTGSLRLPIAGVVPDWSDQTGAVFLDRRLYARRWNDDTVNVFRIYLDHGATPEGVRQAILERFASSRRLFVLTNRDVRAYITRLTDQWLGLAYSQIAVAVLVAVLGIVNTLTVSIIDRRRELGVLRAVGALRTQVRHTIWMEALAIALVGLVLGLGVGALNLHYILEISRREITGTPLAYHFPVQIGLLLVPIILGAAFASALWPAESAVRGSLVEALEYE